MKRTWNKHWGKSISNIRYGIQRIQYFQNNPCKLLNMSCTYETHTQKLLKIWHNKHRQQLLTYGVRVIRVQARRHDDDDVMATTEGGCEKLEKIVTCTLCYEIFSSPRTFKCFHSFCEPCIDKLKHDKTNKSQQLGYKCPLCRR